MKTLLNFRKQALMIVLLSLQCLVSRAQYCPIDFTSGGEAISLVDFAGITNPTSAAGTVTYEDFTAMVGTVVQTQTYTITVKSNTYGPYNNWVRVYVDWNQNQDFSDPGESFDIGAINNSTGADAVEVTGSIAVPVTALTGSTRMRVTARYSSYVPDPCNTVGYGQAEDYTIDVLPAGACSGTPVAGIAAGPSSVCPNSSFNLSVTGYSAASSISFEWQYDDGGGWQPITGATDPSYSVAAGILVSTNYQVVVTCANGGSQDFSNTVTVSVNLPTQCYCAISFSGPDPITLVEFGGISNATAASGAPGYEDYTALTANVVEGQTYVLNVKGTTGGAYTDSIRAFIDWDQNGSFNDPGEAFDLGAIYNSTGTDAVVATANVFIPNNAVVGTTRLRVTKSWDYYPAAGPCNTGGYGQAEDYSVNIVASTTCSGTPVAGTASGPAAVCPSTMFALSLTGYTVAAGADIQWEYYDTGLGSWQPVSGATTPVWNEPGLTVARDYRAIVTCSNGGLSDISNTVSVAINPFYGCYCLPHNAGSNPILNVAIGGTTLNNASGAAALPDFYVSYAPSGSATATLMQGYTYTISALFGSAAIASVWIDYDQNGIYDASEWTQISTTGTSGAAAFTVPPGALTGNTGMRVRIRNAGGVNDAVDACTIMSSGETEDYMVTIVAAVACAGPPAAGTMTAPASVCPTAPFVLDLNGFTVALGVSVQWEEDAGSGWAPIAGATTVPYTVPGITAATSYRAEVSCLNAGAPDFSNTITVNLTPASQCYCSVAFPSGDVEPISTVDFAGISNVSDPSIAGSTQYEDFTAVTGTVAQGQTYTMNVQGNTNGAYSDSIRVFIDWDQNGVLSDPGESYDIGSLYSSSGTDGIMATSDIIVPSGAAIGTTRMRVTKKWSAYASSCNATGYGQAEDYTLNVGFPLAIQLKDIRAVNVGSRNRIDWTTATEFKGDYFELERSRDGSRFVKIATITAKGRSGAYSFWDESPVSGTNYYRLKLIDASGNGSYSKVVTANVKGDLSFTLEAYPNPVEERLTIRSYDAAGNAVLTISDATGKLLKEVQMIGNKAEIDLTGIAPGIYLLGYTDGEYTRTVKINKL